MLLESITVVTGVVEVVVIVVVLTISNITNRSPYITVSTLLIVVATLVIVDTGVARVVVEPLVAVDV